MNLLDSPAPEVDPTEAERIAAEVFGVRGIATNLASERDTNFRIATGHDDGYTLKFANPAEPRVNTNFQTEALRALERNDPQIPVPRVVAANDGRFEIVLKLADGRDTVVRMLTWLEGTQVVKVEVSRGLRRNIGSVLARLGAALSAFDHPGAEHDILWDIRNASRLRSMCDAIDDRTLRTRVLDEIARFDSDVSPRLEQTRTQVVHNDLNHHNVLVRPEAPEAVSGIIDFGDMVKTNLVIDVAVAASYVTGLREDPVACVIDLVTAYHAEVALADAELALLRDLIVMRLVTSIVITTWRAKRYPDNADYILRNNGPARVGMEQFATLPRQQVTRRIRAACGVE